jgi:hypothetical protein
MPMSINTSVIIQLQKFQTQIGKHFRMQGIQLVVTQKNYCQSWQTFG